MKPLFLRGVSALFSLLLGSFPAAHAEWISLQIPLARASHGFSFWQQGGSGSPDWTLPAFAGPMGYITADPYFRRPAGEPILTGGTFDANGNFQADGDSFATISVYREGTGNYFLNDDTASELSPPDQSSLIFADWRTLDGNAPLTFFAIKAARHGHLFAFTDGVALIPLSSGVVQGSLDENGVFTSLGFFNAWAGGISLGAVSSLVVDLTARESVPASLNLLAEGAWQSDTTDYSLQTLTLSFTPAEAGHSFYVYSTAGNSEYVAVPSAGPFAATITLGAGTEFWVARYNPPNGATLHHMMPFSAMTFAVNAELPPLPGGPQPETLHFRISSSRNPAGFHVTSSASGSSVGVTVSPTENTIPVFNSSAGVWVTVPYHDAWATVNVASGYYVTDAAGQNVGQGPDFFDITPTGWESSQTHPALIPLSRQGHALRTSEGFDASWTSNVFQISSTDPFSTPPGAAFSYNTVSLTVPFSMNFGASGNPILLTDLDRGETSPPGTMGSGIVGFEAWHVSQPLVLKVSATRWAHDLRVRCADGRTFFVTAGRIQGDWSTEPLTGTPWFNPYGFFDATAQFQANIPWHLYDVTRSQYLVADSVADATSFMNATDATDSDSDGLADWYERMIGTNPNASGGWDTDGDGQSDGYEVAHGTNQIGRAHV